MPTAPQAGPFRSELADGMRIDWDVPIEMDDGMVLRADVFRPIDDGSYPVILTYGPYAKGLAFEVGYPSAWEQMAAQYPDTVSGSTNKYQNWEVADPEKWVPDGYVIVRADARGCGRSPGYVDHFSAREAHDLYSCIEWAGAQPWSNGRVGMTGISYYAMNQWIVASLQPPHLAAICPWEGAADWYRDATYHGGIRSTFFENWYDMQVKTVQHGLGEAGPYNPNTGQPACGDETLEEAELAVRRSDFGGAIRAHPLDDEYHRERSAKWDSVTVPVLSSGNWGGQGLHLRGNVEGFMRAATGKKWLEMHGGEHWTSFYTDYGVTLQKRFFDYFLKGADNGWDTQPPVQLQVRHADGSFQQRAEKGWPIPRTNHTRLYLDAASRSLVPHLPDAESTVTYNAMTEGVSFGTAPFSTETEITGPLAATLFVESSTPDADLFVIVRAFSPEGEEIVFQGAIDPHTPIAQGWLRASQRKVDPELSLPYRPYHPHDEVQPLEPGVVYRLDVEILPTSLVLPPGYQLSLAVQGSDYVHPGARGKRLSNFKNELTGCGPFLHDDPRDRPAGIFGGRVTLRTGGDHGSHLLLPIVPPR